MSLNADARMQGNLFIKEEILGVLTRRWDYGNSDKACRRS